MIDYFELSSKIHFMDLFSKSCFESQEANRKKRLALNLTSYTKINFKQIK